MADPSGRIIEYPIKANFREGLTFWSISFLLTEQGKVWLILLYGLPQIRLSYSARFLVDVAQDVIVREEDCGTEEGVLLFQCETKMTTL